MPSASPGCDPNNHDQYVCSPQCVPDARGCTSNGDNCGGCCNLDTKLCEPPPGMCIPLGGVCTVDQDWQHPGHARPALARPRRQQDVHPP